MVDLDSTTIISDNENSFEESSNSTVEGLLKVLTETDSKTFQIKDESIIGRSTPSEIIIPVPSLSKQHAKINLTNGKYFLTDLGSSNKTFKNKVQLEANVCYPLMNGDEIKFGDVVCLFEEKRSDSDQIDLPKEKPNGNHSNQQENQLENSSTINKQENVDKSLVDLDKEINLSPKPDSEKLVEKSTQCQNTKDEISSKENFEVTLDQPLVEQTLEQNPETTKQNQDEPTNIVVNQEKNEEKPVVEQIEVEENKSKIDQEENKIDEKAEETTKINLRTRVSTRQSSRQIAARQTNSMKEDFKRKHIELDQEATDQEKPNRNVRQTKESEEETPMVKSRSKSKIQTDKQISPNTKNKKNDDVEQNQPSTVRSSARIRERVSTGRTRQFPYKDDYVNLDEIENKSKPNENKSRTSRKSKNVSPEKLVENKIVAEEKINVKSKRTPKKKTMDVYDQMDSLPQTNLPESTIGHRKRKSLPTTPIPKSKRIRRLDVAQTEPTKITRKYLNSSKHQQIEVSPRRSKSTRRSLIEGSNNQSSINKNKRKKSVSSTNEQTSNEKPIETEKTDRPVRIALSSHLNFNVNNLETLRQLGFQLMDESCHVDALVVDRIRRTKKFFMCLARGAHILSPTWIENMIKLNQYIPYEKFYLEDTNAETRYGFKLRESVRLAKQSPIFHNYKFFLTKETSPPYDDLKDIIEAAGGQIVDKVNSTRPGKDLICVVSQTHKNDYEDLFKRRVPIVSEEFILTGISKQKLDFDSFSLFQSVGQTRSSNNK